MNEDDFGFYDSDEDKESVDEIKGITDKVTDFTYTDIEYPSIVFNDGFSCPKHKMKVISNMVNNSEEGKDTSLYFINGGGLFKLGMLSGKQIESLLELVGVDNVFGYYLDGTRLDGDRIYTLCVL